MKNLLITIFGLIGTIIGAISSIKDVCNEDSCRYINIGYIIIVSACIICILYCLYEYFLNKRVNKFSLEKKEKIDRFLIKKIKQTGSVAIFSRDFTWVKENSDQYNILMKKAKEKELFLFLEEETSVSKKLLDNGASVKIYNNLVQQGFAPKSRFTIINFKGSGKTTLIGCSDDETHTIYTLKSKEHIEIHNLIEEYVKLLDLVCIPLEGK